jgi:hypothetical protein
MDIIKKEKKGEQLNTLERCHIYKISKDRLHIVTDMLKASLGGRPVGAF